MYDKLMALGCLALAICNLYNLLEIGRLNKQIQELEDLKQAIIMAIKEDDENG